MKRWILKAGSSTLEELRMEDVPKPEPGPGEVRVRVHAVSLNYRDQLVVRGTFGDMARDLVPIADGAGEIDAVGSGVKDWKVEDRVVELYFKDWLTGPPHANMGRGLGAGDEDGMLAEYVVLPAARLAHAPDGLNYAEASTLPCAAVTAWSALYGANPIGRQSSVLVVGTGGVSLFAAQLALAIGAKVFAVTSQDAKRDRLFALGVSDVVNYKTTPDWGKAIFQRTGGVHKVVDAAGSLNQSLAALRPGGEVALMGLMTNDGPPSPMTLMARALNIRGISVGNAEAYHALAESLQTHNIKPIIDRTFRFDQAREAYQAQVSPDLFGKVVIQVAS